MASRKHTSGPTAAPSTAAPATEVPDKFCPVCRRQKYLNPDLSFLINPECYHPMCTGCVENIFGKGPAQCPYPGCTKTLRQRGFHPAFFRDLTVEREVDVRRRVQAVFNMAQDDFETLRDYNDYLQQVEDLTFDLVQGGEADRRAAEQKLLAYEQKHKDEIEKNRRRGRDAENQRKQRDAAEAEAARQRRLEEQREEERARAEEASINAEVMEALARGEPGTAADIQARIVAQKRARVAEIAGSHFSAVLNASNTNPTSASATTSSAPGPSTSNLLSIRGLKDKSAQKDDAADYYLRPYDPFAGLDLNPTRYALQPDPAYEYANPWLDDARARDDHRVPGYSTREYVARAMFEAFAGLGVVIGEEKADAARAVGTAGAEAAAASGRTGGVAVGGGRMEVDDVFV
ncbi:CDK-activating kinase assembly factor [Hypoxylon sp. FL0543]|nr:CDK-activating kinase assembly factor [Hypoxylon sp. FL0543]